MSILADDRVIRAGSEVRHVSPFPTNDEAFQGAMRSECEIYDDVRAPPRWRYHRHEREACSANPPKIASDTWSDLARTDRISSGRAACSCFIEPRKSGSRNPLSWRGSTSAEPSPGIHAELVR